MDRNLDNNDEEMSPPPLRRSDRIRMQVMRQPLYSPYDLSRRRLRIGEPPENRVHRGRPLFHYMPEQLMMLEHATRHRPNSAYVGPYYLVRGGSWPAIGPRFEDGVWSVVDAWNERVEMPQQRDTRGPGSVIPGLPHSVWTVTGDTDIPGTAMVQTQLVTHQELQCMLWKPRSQRPFAINLDYMHITFPVNCGRPFCGIGFYTDVNLLRKTLVSGCLRCGIQVAGGRFKVVPCNHGWYCDPCVAELCIANVNECMVCQAKVYFYTMTPSNTSYFPLEIRVSFNN